MLFFKKKKKENSTSPYRKEVIKKEINGICFKYTPNDSFTDDYLSSFANTYYTKSEIIKNFLLENNILDVLHHADKESLLGIIGKPEINLDLNTVSYKNATDNHTITFEYSGILDSLFYFSVNG